MGVSPPESREKKRNGVFCVRAPVPIQLDGACFSVKVRRENGGPWKVGAGLQKNEQFTKQVVNRFTFVSSVSLAFTEAGRRNQLDINAWVFLPNCCVFITSRDPNQNVWCFVRLKVEQTFLKKWEYCPVQTSSQHVNHMFYLPFSSRQLIQLHPLQDVETPHNMTMKRSGKLCGKRSLVPPNSPFSKSMICINTFPTNHNSPSTQMWKGAFVMSGISLVLILVEFWEIFRGWG